MADSDFTIGTDVAHFVLFHPADLAHRDDDPIAWYSYDFAYQRDSRAGALIAWGTGSDGGFRIRLTTGELTAAEKQAGCASWRFPLIVRHGRVLLDNTDALPGQEQMTDPDGADDWYQIDNGAYGVTVYPIDRSEDAKLPDYVVVFTPVASIEGIAVAPTPPDLRPFKDWVPQPGESMASEAGLLWPTRLPEAEPMPLIVVADDLAALPAMASGFPVITEVAELIFPEDWDTPAPDHVLMATGDTPGRLGVIGRRSGLSQSMDEAPRLSLSGRAIARIISTTPGPVLPITQVELVEKPDMTVDAETAEAFRARLLAVESRIIVASSIRARNAGGAALARGDYHLGADASADRFRSAAGALCRAGAGADQGDDADVSRGTTLTDI